MGYHWAEAACLIDLAGDVLVTIDLVGGRSGRALRRRSRTGALGRVTNVPETGDKVPFRWERPAHTMKMRIVLI
jgi:hypothetical protein